MTDSLTHILFFGDIVGSSGRRALRQMLPALKEEFNSHLVIANGENAAHGFGLTPDTSKEILESGVDVITGGNHTWDKREIVEAFQLYPNRILRPANYSFPTEGSGHTIAIAKNGVKVGIINLMGRVFMDPLDCPFHAFDRIYEELHKQTSVIFVDLHAEATSEKSAMGWHIDGRASAMVGTHTHVQTADEQILPKGTGFLTDAGMTGPLHSVIGIKTECVLGRFLEKKPIRMEVAEGKAVVQGICYSIDSETGKCKKLVRIRRLES